MRLTNTHIKVCIMGKYLSDAFSVKEILKQADESSSLLFKFAVGTLLGRSRISGETGI